MFECEVSGNVYSLDLCTHSFYGDQHEITTITYKWHQVTVLTHDRRARERETERGRVKQRKSVCVCERESITVCHTYHRFSFKDTFFFPSDINVKPLIVWEWWVVISKKSLKIIFRTNVLIQCGVNLQRSNSCDNGELEFWHNVKLTWNNDHSLSFCPAKNNNNNIRICARSQSHAKISRNDDPWVETEQHYIVQFYTLANAETQRAHFRNMKRW